MSFRASRVLCQAVLFAARFQMEQEELWRYITVVTRRIIYIDWTETITGQL